MSNSLRITGLATGLDTDSLVKQMMKPYNIKLDKMKQDKQVVQWRQDLYRDIIKDIMDLRDAFLNSTKPDTNMLSSNPYAAFDTQIAVGGEGKVSLSANANAVAGQYKINVVNLATKAHIEGVALTTTTVSADTGATITNPASITTKISDLTGNSGVTLPQTLTVNYGPSTPPIATGNITIDSNSTIGSVIDSVNKNENLKGKVTARFSELTGSIILESAVTGDNEKITLGGDWLNILKIDPDSTDPKMVSQGKNANVTITPLNGNPVPVNRATNNFTIDGITYNLLSQGETDFTVNPSEQKTFDKFVKFIDKYNSLIEKLNIKQSEKRQYSYTPLTDEQKKEMKEEDIKAWEEKAKSGLLSGDSVLAKLRTSLRQVFFEPVTGVSLKFGSNGLGMDTAARYKDAGKIVITDEAKFKAALRNNPQEIMNLFMKNPPKDSTNTFNDSGIIRRISTIIENNVGIFGRPKGELIDKAGYIGSSSEVTNTLTKLINDQEKKIQEFQATLASKENKFYLQFAALEKNMNKMNSQSSWMQQQLGG